jgi:hypothetical protein
MLNPTIYPQRDPDATAVPVFKYLAQLNPAKTAKEGRPIFDDIEVVEIRFPGSRNYQPFPAHSQSHIVEDPITGADRPVTYAERFRKQYEQFKAHAAQTKSGTPLVYVPFLTEARRAELHAQNIYTVEALAVVEGFELKNLGYQGRELKNKAIEYITERKNAAPDLQLQAELEALRARNQALEADVATLKAHHSEAETSAKKIENQLVKLTNEQLKALVEEAVGQPLQGVVPRPTLLRMAIDAQLAKAAVPA